LGNYQKELPLYDRYLAGEHVAIWRELGALGARVRQDPHAADALAVATETMSRVRTNALVLAERLMDVGTGFTRRVPPSTKKSGTSKTS
jgi:hypothetical protein